MFQTNQKAQSSLEYLMTYGWALILIAAVVGVLVFIISSPVSTVSFSSSNPTKIIVKAGAIQNTTATAILQNITGGRINITDINQTGASYTLPCTINEKTTDIDVPAGGTMQLECPLSGEYPTGAVTINYTDFAGIQRTTTIKIGGGQTGPPGSPINPFQISSCAELQAIENDLSASYVLASDIDCSETSGWNGGQGFVPISSFSGSLDGQGHAISNLTINRPASNDQAMFNNIASGGEIKDLTLTSPTITGYSGVVGLAVTNNGTIKDLTITSPTITGEGSIAGLAAMNNGTIENVLATNVSINGTSFYAAGLAAFNNGTINGCGTSGSVQVKSHVAGLVSENAQDATITDSFSTAQVDGGASGTFYGSVLVASNEGTINRCYTNGLVRRVTHIGGIAGYNGVLGTITNSYSQSVVDGTGKSNIGGLVGLDFGAMTNCYASGPVTGGVPVGGVVGISPPGACTDCFWDTQTTGQAASDCGAAGKTTAEMMQQATFTTPPSDWDFSSIWNINEGTSYPFLR